MPSDKSDSHLLEKQCREANAQLVRRLRAGHDCRVEDLLNEYTGLAGSSDHVLDLILAEFDAREDLGQSPSREVFYQRFPQWRDALKRLFEDIDKEEFKDKRGLEDYEPIEELGRGPMGTVWRARQICHGREVVLKMFAGGDHADLERFRRGAEDQARLKHVNIVTVYEVGTSLPFFAMELGEGGSLDRKNRRPAATAAGGGAVCANPGQGHAPCARTGDRPPRSEAGQRGPHRGRGCQDYRLRPGQEAGPECWPDPKRGLDRHAAVHGARAGVREERGHRAAHGRLRPGGHPV